MTNTTALPVEQVDELKQRITELLGDYNGYDSCGRKACNGWQKQIQLTNELLQLLASQATAAQERAEVEFCQKIDDKVRLEFEAGGRYPGHLIEPWQDVVRPMIYAKLASLPKPEQKEQEQK